MEPIWVKELKTQFPVTEKTTFFDIAYENCGATFVKDAIDRFFLDKADIYPEMTKAGGSGKGKMIKVIAETRELVSRFINSPHEHNIAFTKNTNEGINIILRGFPFKQGDKIITSSIEYTSILLACLNMKNYGVDCAVVQSDDGFTVSAEELINAFDEKTRMVIISHVQSSSGYKTDIKKLAEACHKKNIFLVVDGIQALGFSVVDVQDMNIDALSTSCYKGLLATEGIGFLYCCDELLALTRVPFLADNNTVGIDRDNWSVINKPGPNAQKFENGTISFIGIYGLHAALKQILSIGIKEIGRHISTCYEKIYSGLTEQGYEIVTPFAEANRCHSVVMRVRDSKEAESFFATNGIYLSRAKNNCVRISVSPFTTYEDIDKLIAVAVKWT